MPDLESLLERLVRNRVAFVVVGGFAAVAHGVSLLTEDVDVCCRFTPANLLKLQAAVIDLHPVHRMTPARLPLALTPQSCAGLKNLYLDTDYGQLDCLGEVKGIGDYNKVAQRGVLVDLPFGPCRVLDIDALIRSKEAMDRPRDKAAIVQLRAIKERSRFSR
ncbi:MAG: hypothetical protein ABSD29_21735 [Verrucomicrobiota bacterium]|jgi:hypothetical protein